MGFWEKNETRDPIIKNLTILTISAMVKEKKKGYSDEKILCNKEKTQKKSQETILSEVN